MQTHFAQLTQYCETHSTPPNEVLHELERETHLKTLSPHMISGRLQGQFLQFISQMIRPKYVLEVGTFTGYAAICLAKGLAEDGVLHTIEINPELEWLAQKYFAKAELDGKIQLHIGDARQLIPAFSINFDLIFIDANKQENDLFYEMCLEKLRPGGFLMVDNVLWSGKVITTAADLDTRLIREFNDKLATDLRVECLMLPLRDGLTLIRKKETS